MKNVYIKDNGKKVSVTVTETVEKVLKDTRRTIWRNEAKERYHCELSLDAMTDKDELAARTELNPETMLIAKEEQAERTVKLAAAIKTLTPEQLRLTVLIYVKNLPLREIAERYGITYQAVQNRQKKILEKLRKFF